MNPLDHSIQNLKLLYFDFQFINFALGIVRRLRAIYPWPLDTAAILRELKPIEQAYIETSAQLTQMVDMPSLIEDSMLAELNQTLASALAQTYQYRELLYAYLVFFAGTQEPSSSQKLKADSKYDALFTDLIQALRSIDLQLDRIICLLNRDGELSSESDRTQFEAYLTTVLTATGAAVDRLTQKERRAIKKSLQVIYLQNVFGEHYANAFEQQVKTLLLTAWQAELKKFVDQLQDKPLDFSSVLMAKALLAEHKLQFYIRFYDSKKKYEAAAADALCELIFSVRASTFPSSIDIGLVRSKLERHLCQLREDISDLEKSCRRYTVAQSIAGNGLRLWLRSYYYTVSETLFNLAEAATAEGIFVDWPVLSVQLSPSYFHMFLAIASALWCKVDHWLYGGATLAFTLSRSLNQHTLSHFLLPVCEYTGFNEERSLSYLPAIRWSLGLLLHIATFVSFTDYDRHTIGMLTTCYIAATSLQALSARLTNKLEARLFDKTDRLGAQARQLFVKHWLQQYSYRLGNYAGASAYQSGVTFFAKLPDRDTILADKKLCLDHAAYCEKVALETLELPTHATSQEIQAAWRNKMRKQHPDIANTSSDESHADTVRANNARERLLQFRP